MRLEGGMKDYELPEITEELIGSEVDNLFDDQPSNGGNLKADPAVVQ